MLVITYRVVAAALDRKKEKGGEREAEQKRVCKCCKKMLMRLYAFE